MNKKIIMFLFSLFSYNNVSFGSEKQMTITHVSKKAYEGQGGGLFTAASVNFEFDKPTVAATLFLTQNPNNYSSLSAEAISNLYTLWKTQKETETSFWKKTNEKNLLQLTRPDDAIINHLEKFIGEKKEKSSLESKEAEKKEITIKENSPINRLFLGAGLCLSALVLFILQSQYRLFY